MADFSLTFLGTGTSVGVPVIGCDCEVCRSEELKNKRFRSSVVVRAGDVTILVDSGPDLRMQALREGLREIDAVIYTHAHLDHVAGFDELRAFCWRKHEPLPLHATEGCMETLVQMYGWAFSPEIFVPGYVRPEARVIDGPFYYGDLKITPLPVTHAAVETIGFLFEYPGAAKVAYISDVKIIPEETMALIRGVDVLVIDALRTVDHPTHFTLAEALAAVEESGAKEAWLTHLTHEFDTETLEAMVPANVHVAWDGLRILGLAHGRSCMAESSGHASADEIRCSGLALSCGIPGVPARGSDAGIGGDFIQFHPAGIEAARGDLPRGAGDSDGERDRVGHAGEGGHFA